MTRNLLIRRSRLVLFAAIILAPLIGVYPQTSASAQITELDVNGLKVIVKRRPGAPTVAAGLFFRGGTRNLSADRAGLENMTLTVAAEATKNYPRQRLRKETSRIGTAISAGSTFDFSVLSLASTKQNFETSWNIFVDVAINPTFAADDVERVRELMITSLRAQNDSPEGQLDTTSNEKLFAGHPYSVDPDGTVSSVSKFSAADLAAYHKQLMQTTRMLLVIVGDVEPAEIEKQVAASLGKLPRGNYKDVPMAKLKFDKPTLDVVSRTVQTNYVKGVFAAPSIGEPDYYAMRTAVTMLQSKVFEEVRTKRNLSYAPDAVLNNNSDNTAEISVSSVNPNAAVGIMLDEINKLKQGAFEEDSIGQMSGFFLTTYYLGQETNAAQAASLAQYELIGGGWRNSLEFLDRLRRVTPADVKAAANKYMKNIRFVVVGNPADVDRSVFIRN